MVNAKKKSLWRLYLRLFIVFPVLVVKCLVYSVCGSRKIPIPTPMRVFGNSTGESPQGFFLFGGEGVKPKIPLWGVIIIIDIFWNNSFWVIQNQVVTHIKSFSELHCSRISSINACTLRLYFPLHYNSRVSKQGSSSHMYTLQTVLLILYITLLLSLFHYQNVPYMPKSAKSF